MTLISTKKKEMNTRSGIPEFNRWDQVVIIMAIQVLALVLIAPILMIIIITTVQIIIIQTALKVNPNSLKTYLFLFKLNIIRKRNQSHPKKKSHPRKQKSQKMSKNPQILTAKKKRIKESHRRRNKKIRKQPLHQIMSTLPSLTLKNHLALKIRLKTTQVTLSIKEIKVEVNINYIKLR